MNKITAFWKWFLDNESKLYNLSTEGNHALFDEISTELKKIDQMLTFELSGINIDGKREFILSANGIRNVFPIVFSLHEQAPKFCNWEIIALKPRYNNPEELVLNISGENISLDEIFFEYFPENDCLSVIIYFKADYPENVLGQIGFIYLDLLLGEYDVATKLGHIEFRNIEDLESNSLFPLKDLRDIMDNFFPDE